MADDKKITEMTEMAQPNSETWLEVVDLTESDPSLQNKKIKAENVDPEAHVQDTDQYLDKGGNNQVWVNDADVVINRPLAMGWIQSSTIDPSTTGFMRVGVDFEGTRVLQFNLSSVGGINLSSVMTSIAVGTTLLLTFNDGGGSYLCTTNTPFANLGQWVQASCDAIDDNFTSVDGSVGILTIIKL